MKVGIFGSEYQIERQNLIKRLFEKLREQEADIYVDSPFYTFLTDAFGFEPVVSGLLVGDEFDPYINARGFVPLPYSNS